MNARLFASQFRNLFKLGRFLKADKASTQPRSKIPSNAPKALIFSPHPDDECIVGGLALRLMRESKWNILNVAVTSGSKKGRRAARLRELQNACDLLGFGLIVPSKQGFQDITLKSRKQNPAYWKMAVRTIAEILAVQRPRVIFIPHEDDGHPVHVGTHFLVLDALRTLPIGFQCHIVETEFWGQMTDPNLLIELDDSDAGDLIAALACHVGEVRRNRYDARLPGWLIDNVRRGAERVGEQGGVAPDFAFGVLYRHQKWKQGRLVPVQNQPGFVSSAVHVGKYFG